jgi:hypothetical protein
MSIPEIQNEMRLLRRTTRVGFWINKKKVGVTPEPFRL